ncbi:MAG: cupin domain-containing protein [Terracidiphilus sp.]
MTINSDVGSGLVLPSDPAVPVIDPEPGLRRQVLVHSPSMMLVRHQMRKGWRGAAHRHPHEQMVYVLSGRIRIRVENAWCEAVAGDNFIVTSNAEHEAEALEDSVVLDVFTPAREDYCMT